MMRVIYEVGETYCVTHVHGGWKGGQILFPELSGQLFLR